MRNTKILFQDLLLFTGLLLLNVSFFASRLDFIHQNTNAIEVSAYIIFSILFIKYISGHKLKSKFILVLLSCIIISLISLFITNSPILLRIILLILATLDIDFKKIVKLDLLVKITVLVLVVFSYQLGILGDDLSIWRNEISRLSFGFNHPNTLSIFCLFMLFEFIYLFIQRQRSLCIFFAVLLCIITFTVTDTRSVTFITLVLLLLLILPKKLTFKIINSGLFKKITFLLYPLFIIASILVTTFFINGNSQLNQLNLVLSNRLEYQAFYLKNYNINFFGNNIEYVGKQVIDNSFFQLPVHYGILAILFFYIIFLNLLKKSFTHKDYSLIIIVLCILSLGVLERAIILPVFNIFLIYPLFNLKKALYDK